MKAWVLGVLFCSTVYADIPGVIQESEFGKASAQNLGKTLVDLEAGTVQAQGRCREDQRLECGQSQDRLLNHERYKSTEELAVRRVYDHLLIQDLLAAVKEAKKVTEEFPLSQSAYYSLIHALSAKGDEMEAWEYWQKGTLSFPQMHKNRHMLETMAWGVLNKGENAASLSIKLSALMGAAFTRDVKAIPLLLKALKSSSAQVRSVAVKLIASYPDLPLKEELARMLKEEKVWYVRLEVIQVIGHLKILVLKEQLQELICHPHTLMEEKATALIALIQMYETISREELLTLMKSTRAPLRELAASIILHLNLEQDVDLLLPLLKDTCPDVRLTALTALGFLRPKEIQGKPLMQWIRPSLSDSYPSCALTASWVALLLSEPEGKEHLRKWLSSSHAYLRRLAASAIGASGAYGVDLAWKGMQESEDSFVRVNLALGLIGQREHVTECAKEIAAALKETGTLWMWDQGDHPLFHPLAPSRVSHVEHIPQYPAVVDQMTRLELLSVLTIVRYPGAQEAVRTFLQTGHLYVTGTAAMTLLQEGDEEDLSLVGSLLSDPDENVRVQAALILAILGNDPRAVDVLQKAYPHASREMKVHILEALAHIGAPQSVPFLLEIFKEPFQLLRVVAASALIQCLYH